MQRNYNRSVYSAYNLVFAAALVLSLPWWLLKMLRYRKYRAGLSERLGRVPQRLLASDTPTAVWIHAVSVGEVLAIARVAEEMKEQLAGRRIVISTTTDTGQRLARERFGGENVFYAPLDLPLAVRAYLRALRPQMLLLAESEFWPNLLRLARESGAVVAVVNARVSDRSLPRYLRFRRWLRPILANVQLFLAQSDEDARRLVQMGAPAERVRVSGNLKFEAGVPRDSAISVPFERAIRREGAAPVLIAGSTLEGEEAMLLDTFRTVRAKYPAALLVLAPRHPQRFAGVAALLASSGLPNVSRSQWAGGEPLAGKVFLLDSIGELASLYPFADVAFVGGSLVPQGGHNVLEAAVVGAPILVGPHTENFRSIVEIFLQADALRVVTPDSLTPTVMQLLESGEERAALGERARELMRQQRNATAVTLSAVLELLSPHPRQPVGQSVERSV